MSFPSIDAETQIIIIREALEEQRILRAWGRDVYEKLQAYYASDAYKQQMNDTVNAHWTAYGSPVAPSAETTTDMRFENDLLAKTVRSILKEQSILEMGGEENYNKMQAVYASSKYKEEMLAGYERVLESANKEVIIPKLDEDGTNVAATPSSVPQSHGVLTPDQISLIKKNAIIEGKKDAPLTIVEYVDPECPFCIKQYNDKTIENIITSFTGQINYIFKVVQGVNHPWTEYKSLAILCAAKLKWASAYIAMYKKILWNSSASNVVSVEQVEWYAKDINIPLSYLRSCIEKWDTKSFYAENIAEIQTFSSTYATPSTVIINNKTGERQLISGAYPLEIFKVFIDKWVK